MSTHTHVPADDEATSVLDLVTDCREVSGVLAPYVPAPARQVSAGQASVRTAPPVRIGASAAAGARGWDDY